MNQIKHVSNSKKKNGDIQRSQIIGNINAKSKTRTTFNDNKTKKYRGDDVDILLSNEILDCLNNIKEIEICSVCSGHEKGVSSMNRGGSHYAGINFRIYPYLNSYYIGIYDDIKESLLLPNTKVKVRFDGDYPPPSHEQCSIIICIDSTIPMSKENLGRINRWWRILAKRMQKVEWNMYLSKEYRRRKA